MDWIVYQWNWVTTRTSYTPHKQYTQQQQELGSRRCRHRHNNWQMLKTTPATSITMNDRFKSTQSTNSRKQLYYPNGN